jgi:hypothetical protein
MLRRKKSTSHVLAHDEIDGGKNNGSQHDPLQKNVSSTQETGRESGGLHQARLPKYLDGARWELSVTQETNTLCNRKDHRLGRELLDLSQADGTHQGSWSVQTERGETAKQERQERLCHSNALTDGLGSLQCLAREHGLANVDPNKEKEGKHLQKESHMTLKPCQGLGLLGLELLV